MASHDATAPPQAAATAPGSHHTNNQPPASFGTVFTNAKAGMEAVDAEHVKRVVYELSKDSPHYANEQRKMAATEARVRRMRAAAAALTPAELDCHTAAMDAKRTEMEASRDLTRTWLHLDMDAFFAAVEELDDPSLRGRPFAVGGIGMISTASYAARKYGVRSAMPGFIALKLCPDLVFVPGSFDKYRAAAEKTRAVFVDYDADFEAGSLDEAALDVTDVCTRRGMSGAEIAEELRRRVRTETGLTCSCGVAPNRTLAKICSDRNKPDGQHCLPPSRDAVLAFVHDLSIRKMPGIGRVTEHVLKAFGVERCGDLLARRGLLAALFSPISVEFFMLCALGLGATEHAPAPAAGEVGRKGISCERTFRAMSARPELEAMCQELAKHLAADMAAEGLRGRTLTLKLKATTFELRTRALTLDRHVSSAEDILAAALKLLRAELPVEIRLMGLRMSNFYEEARREQGQPSLEELLQRRARGKAANGGESTGAAGAASGDAASLGPAVELADKGGGRDDVVVQEGRGEDDDVAHTSQVLSAGDLLELTLREWNDGDMDPAAVGEGAADAALPPSLTVSPATAAQYDAEQQRDRRGQIPALHMPATTLDRAVRQLAPAAAAEAPSALQPGEELQPPEGEGEPRRTAVDPGTWPCEACTFINPRGAGWCEMCGTSRSGRRAPAASTAAGVPKPKSKKRSHPSTGAGNILAFCVPKEQAAKRQAASSPAQPVKIDGGAAAGSAGRASPTATPAAAAPEGNDPDPSPLQPGEDLVECPSCGDWVRDSHFAGHSSAHTAG